ncbi:MAG TPA: hypothetical protein VF997_09115, partial [Polyangia bacterium]
MFFARSRMVQILLKAIETKVPSTGAASLVRPCVGLVACGSASTGTRDLALPDLAVSDLAPVTYSCPALDADGGAFSACQFFSCKPTLTDARRC